MPCQTIQIEDGVVLSINRPGPMREIHRESTGTHWCFRCRARREFFYVVTAEVEPSYYGPNHAVKCGSCGQPDGDCFPGTYREWEG